MSVSLADQKGNFFVGWLDVHDPHMGSLTFRQIPFAPTCLRWMVSGKKRRRAGARRQAGGIRLGEQGDKPSLAQS